jgi:Holliday junction DNA helicase RuvA
MIAQLKGFIHEVTTEAAVLDVNGVGYELTCSLNTLAELQADLMSGAGATAKPSKPVLVYTYTHVREDVLQLFGFATKTEKQLFTTLLKVNGIGPKMAINILSGGTVEHILAMIEAEDVKALSKLPKVGKKTAEQMVLTLKGKLVIQEASPTKAAGLGSAASAFAKGLTPALRDISSALVNLGFRPQDVETVVSQMPKEIDLQEGIRQGLSALSSQ